MSRDAALVEEVHKDLLVGFATRGGYAFESDHPDFQQFCDVLFVDLRGPGVQGDPAEGLAFIDAIRKSVSHPPIVALCDAGAADFAREVMRRGAYERLAAPLKMPQLRLALQRAYEFRLAETKLETFLSEETATHERPQGGARRQVRPTVRPAAAAPRALQLARQHFTPSRLAVGFVLGCVLFFAGLVAVRSILSGMGNALASAGLAADSGAAPSGNTVVTGPASGNFGTSHTRPLTATADFSQGGFDADSASHPFVAEAPFVPAAGSSSSLPGYEPAVIVERVSPRYSLEARTRHVQGTVRIRAVIGKDGVPRGLARAGGDPILAQIAMDAIALWRYAPATIDGNPVESEVIIPVDFRLPD